MQKLLTFFQQKYYRICHINFNDQSFNDMLTNNIVSFEQLGSNLYVLTITPANADKTTNRSKLLP